ncbi:AAA family ATPase [Arthrobacter alpinus]|uniref:AAA family ATPase n=1 Tax=Arthrobacter alpinus TaxID=656366 RepID=UPI000A70B029|nr:hypothetical protein [Arthrobacter alpinus]
MNEASKNEASKNEKLNAVTVIAVGDTSGGVIAELGKIHGSVRIVRRCPELAELLAACQNGLAQAAVVAEGAGILSATLVDRLAAVGVTVIAVAATPEEAQRLRSLGASPVTEQVTPERLGQVVIAAVQSRRQLDAAGYAVPTLPTGGAVPVLNPFQDKDKDKDKDDDASPVPADTGSTVGSTAADVRSMGAGDGPAHLSRRAARGAKRLAAKNMPPKAQSEKGRQASRSPSDDERPEMLGADALTTDPGALGKVVPSRVVPGGADPTMPDHAISAAEEPVGGGFADPAGSVHDRSASLWGRMRQRFQHDDKNHGQPDDTNPRLPGAKNSTESGGRSHGPAGSQTHGRTTQKAHGQSTGEGSGKSTSQTPARRVPSTATEPASRPVSRPAAQPPTTVRPERSTLVALWGPIGSPGRTTVAINLAAEHAAAGMSVMVIDADSYGASIAAALGLLEESASFAQACRVADQGALSAAQFSAIATKVVFSGGTFSLLTGLTRPDRWPELRAAAVLRVLKLARESAQLVVVDCGFSLENDEELSYDTVAPRRNGATLTVLAEADIIYAVGSGDPVGIPRLIRGMQELEQACPGAHVEVVVNKVRHKAAGRAPEKALAQAWERFGPAQPISHFLPWDPDLSDKALLEGRLLLEIAPEAPLRKGIRGIHCAAVQQNAEIAVSSATAKP